MTAKTRLNITSVVEIRDELVIIVTLMRHSFCPTLCCEQDEKQSDTILSVTGWCQIGKRVMAGKLSDNGYTLLIIKVLGWQQ